MLGEKALTAVLVEIASRWEIPGMAVGIVTADDIVYARYLGVQNLATQRPVTEDSIFCVASMSKSFVATAVMQLVERGLVDLDSALVRYLPYFRMDDERYSLITIRHLLSHTSGMPDMDDADYDDFVAHPEWDEGAPERYVRRLSTLKMSAQPGYRFQYSNIAYNVLGDLIAKVTGMTFETYMKMHVLAPAGMPGSTFLFAEVPRDRLSVPHIRIPEMTATPFYPYHRADAPASFLHATLTDMCHWLMTCLNQGFFAREQILLPVSLELMWTPLAHWGYPPLYEDMGLGWTLGHYNGCKTASHGGMGFGWTDFMVILPKKKSAAVVLCNEESFARGRTVCAVIDAILGLEPMIGTVSWMIPVCQALRTGGIEEANAWYENMNGDDREKFSVDEDDLINLALQMRMAKRIELASAVLELNLRAFPQSIETLNFLGQLYQAMGKPAQARKCLAKVLSFDPDNTTAADQLGTQQ